MQTKEHHTSEHIVFLGEANFPFGLAAIQRMILMGKSLVYEGFRATVICRKGNWTKNEKPNFNTTGNIEGVDYRYTTKNVLKPKGFIDRNVEKLKGVFGEYKYLKHLKRHDKIDLAIVSNRNIVHVLRYLFYSTYLDFPIALNLVEMASSMQDRNTLLNRINDYLLDKYIIKLFDGALPISDKLMSYYKTLSPQKPCLKLPILCDFEKFDLQKEKEESYFLYCGSMAYRQVIDFIVEAYKSLPEKESAKLFMIVSGGSKREVDSLQQEINDQFDVPHIKLFSDIPYELLVHLYVNAIALLIPLRPTVQDSSRFPHKIGEYLASGNPIITTNVGEIKNYFEDERTALIADTYAISTFAAKMRFVLREPKRSKEIGAQGKALGLKEFDYRTHGVRLRAFINELSNAG